MRHFRNLQTCNGVIVQSAKVLFTHIRKLLPVILGGAVGFLGVANILSFFLEKYPDPSVCLFVGLIAGMLPSLMREAGKKDGPTDHGSLWWQQQW